jgi:hypothetical protein
MADFIEEYLNYVRETESPYTFHRWSAISSIGAVLGRSLYLPFGHSRIFPNLYIMFVGDAGSRKSSAIKIAAKLARAAGYDNFAANKTRLEKFLLDLEGVVTDESGATGKAGQAIYDPTTAANLWGDLELSSIREVFISADEWTDFAPRGDIDFYTLLGTLWDWDDESVPYRHRLKNSRSVSIFQPTVSILGGITPEKFANAFPTEIIGGGFLSRMIIVGGERSGRKYTIPKEPNPEATKAIVSGLQGFTAVANTPATISPGAFKILDAIYKGWPELDDVRFKSYSQRRFTQLLKLSLILTASKREGWEISDETVIRANTYLAAAERVMPAALGEFGKSKNSDIANKIMEVLGKSSRALSIKDLWKHVHQDLERASLLGDIMQGLLQAERVQLIPSQGYLPKVRIQPAQEFVDFGILTPEERGEVE